MNSFFLGRASGFGVDATMVGGGFVGFPVGAERFGGLCAEVVVFSPSGMRTDWFGGSAGCPPRYGSKVRFRIQDHVSGNAPMSDHGGLGWHRWQWYMKTAARVCAVGMKSGVAWNPHWTSESSQSMDGSKKGRNPAIYCSSNACWLSPNGSGSLWDSIARSCP